jgi:hypothetical protein
VRPRLGRRAWTRPSCSLPVATPMPMTNEAPRRALSAVGDHSADLGPGRDRRVRRSPRVGELRDLRGGHRPIGGERLGGIPRARTCRQRWLPSHYITCAYGRLSRRKWRWPVRDRHAVAAAGLFAICSALGGRRSQGGHSRRTVGHPRSRIGRSASGYWLGQRPVSPCTDAGSRFSGGVPGTTRVGVAKKNLDRHRGRRICRNAR